MRFLLMCLSFFTIINVSHAGLFGPQNYDECILDKIDKMKNEEAVKALKAACFSKFTLNQKDTWEDKKLRADRDKLLKKCGISEEKDYSADNAFLTVISDKRPASYRVKNYEVISRLEKTKLLYHGNEPYYSFVNHNEFSISGLVFGYLKKDYKNTTCSNSRNDYDALVFCGVPSVNAQNGVGSMQYGEFPCQESATKFPGQSSCILGYRPAIDYFTEGLSKFMDKHGLCEPK